MSGSKSETINRKSDLQLYLVLLSVVDHLLNVLLGEPALVVGNGDLVLLSSRLVRGGNVEDAVGVDVEAHLDLERRFTCNIGFIL